LQRWVARTPYQQSGYRGGFTEARLAPDIFAISFAVNSFTSPERVSDFALLRAAELTLNNGYNRFTLLNVARRFQHFGSQIFSGWSLPPRSGPGSCDGSVTEGGGGASP